MSDLSGTGILISLICGAIGVAAFMYGKKQALWKPMVLGIALIGFPYFITDIRIQAVVGVALTAGLFIFRD